ncbi:hypothetical protein NSP_24210 [Nodularia spumigena CCY9414]|nr:hypothetical protein NSP_24210 [Nodularia spumigena CCY9414]
MLIVWQGNWAGDEIIGELRKMLSLLPTPHSLLPTLKSKKHRHNEYFNQT